MSQPTRLYGVLAKQQPTRSARNRKREAGDGLLQGNRQHAPAPHSALGYRGAGRVGHEAGVGYFPVAPDFGSEDNEPLRPSAGELRVARDFASASCNKLSSLMILMRMSEGRGAVGTG